VFEIPQLTIQQAEGRYVALYGDAEIPLPTPEDLRREAAEFCRKNGEMEAADALTLCDLSYDVADGGGIEQLIEVVIAASDAIYDTFQDHGHPVTQGVMGALIMVCPDLGSDRVVRKP